MAKGSWIWDGNKEECICSECGKGNLSYSTAFCPDCGADMRGEPQFIRKENVSGIAMKILKEALAIIQRLGTQTQDCTSCARLPLCNAYKDGDSFKGCDYRWRGADEVEQYDKS